MIDEDSEDEGSAVSREEMQKIIAACGQHAKYDHHYHCYNCGGKSSMQGHYSMPSKNFTCEPRSMVSHYISVEP